MKQIRIVSMLIFCTLSLLHNMNGCMKIEHNSDHTYFVSLPLEIQHCIYALSFPSMNLLYDKKPDFESENEANLAAIKKELPLVAQEIMTLRCTCKLFNTFIAEHITKLLHLNPDNMHAFLIRSTQANIPYFTKLAVAQSGDCNIVHAPDGFTPLLYAAQHNCYHACTLLLTHGADVNLKMKRPATSGYGYNSYCNWPIHMAVKSGDEQLVTLFIKHGAQLNVRLNNNASFTLLSIATGQNSPAVLEALLTLCPVEDYIKNWGKNGIGHATTTVLKRYPLQPEHHKEQQPFLELLIQAEERNKHQLK